MMKRDSYMNFKIVFKFKYYVILHAWVLGVFLMGVMFLANFFQ